MSLPSGPAAAPSGSTPVEASSRPARAPAVGPRPVAPWLHTAVLLAWFLAIAGAGALFQNRTQVESITATRPPVVPLYISLIAGEWLLVYFVWKAGLRRRGTSMRSIIGGRWPSAMAWIGDAALAAGLLGAWRVLELVLDRAIGPDPARSISSLLPHGGLEGVLWVALSISAGFSEEFVFRGYLQSQFAAWTRRPWVALVLQSLVFGIAHGYQGAQACARIAVFGLLFGAFALWRRTLRPGMIAHAATDILAGIFRI